MGPCEEYLERIGACLDGELDGAERRALMEHLAVCAACREYFEDQLAIQEALSGLEAPAPEGFAARVMERVRAEETPAAEPERRTILFPGWRRWAAMAACCAVVCLGIFGSGLFSGQSGPAEQTKQPAAAQTRTAGPEAVPAAEPEEAAAGGESLPAEMALDSGEGCAPAAVQSDSAAVESGKVAMPPQAPAAAKRTEEAAGGRTLAASGPAARAWVESELGLPWEPGTAYKLTAEQYLELTALLAEAGENFEESPGEAESWLLLASGEE